MFETVLKIGLDDMNHVKTHRDNDLWYKGDNLNVVKEGYRVGLEPVSSREKTIEVEHEHLSSYIHGTDYKEVKSIEEEMICEIVTEDGEVLAALKKRDIILEEEFPTGRDYPEEQPNGA